MPPEARQKGTGRFILGIRLVEGMMLIESMDLTRHTLGFIVRSGNFCRSGDHRFVMLAS